MFNNFKKGCLKKDLNAAPAEGLEKFESGLNLLFKLDPRSAGYSNLT